AALVLDFDSLTFNGRPYPFAANITATNLQKQGGSSTSQTVKSAAIGAAAGAVLGAILSGADKDKILLGAGLGAVAGTAISLGRGGENAVLPAGSQVSFRRRNRLRCVSLCHPEERSDEGSAARSASSRSSYRS